MRLDKINAQITPCNIFADIGCDHGFIAKHALDNNLCKSAIITDISLPSLEKAKSLLFNYIQNGRVTAYNTDGLSNVKVVCNQAVIAGMGGLEIISILKGAKFLPHKLILQPMKNQVKLRQFLNKHYIIEKDFLFYSDKHYYNLIVATLGQEKLSQMQIEYGKSNLIQKNDDFLRYITNQITLTKTALNKAKNKEALQAKLKSFENVLQIITKL